MYNYFSQLYDSLPILNEKLFFCTQQANTAWQKVSCEMFIADRWEQDCGWNCRYLSAPVNLCCHTVVSCLPQEKSNQRDCLSTGPLPGW